MNNWIQSSRRRINLQALRTFQRFFPAERQRVFVLTSIIGVLCGLAAVAFHLAIMGAESLLIERAIGAPAPYWMLLTIVTPTVGAAISGVFLTYFVPDARGSGIPQVKVAYAIKGGQMPMRVAVGKFLIGIMQIGSGASLGREGPTVQICAGIASLFGRISALSRQNQRALLPVGAAAGIAAAFNAPIAAVTFTIEEVIGDLDQTVLAGVIVAAALAAAIERLVLGTHPVLEVHTVYTFQHCHIAHCVRCARRCGGIRFGCVLRVAADFAAVVPAHARHSAVGASWRGRLRHWLAGGCRHDILRRRRHQWQRVFNAFGRAGRQSCGANPASIVRHEACRHGILL